MMPGIRYLPVASTIVAPAAAATFGPTSAIFPSRIRTDPWNVPFVTVRTVAFCITIGVAAKAALAAARITNNNRFIEFLQAPAHWWSEQRRAVHRQPELLPEEARTSRHRR